MKAIAYILIVSLAFMGLNRFMHGMANPEPKAEVSCQMDCCGDEETTEHGSDHQCPPGCDCGCCFHLTAINYQFMSLPGADVQTQHYGNYQDSYHFDYFIPLFQPPRLAS